MDERQKRAIEKHENRLARLRSHLGYPGNAEPSFVNLNKTREVHYWAVKFGCGREHIQFAVEHVGTIRRTWSNSCMGFGDGAAFNQ